MQDTAEIPHLSLRGDFSHRWSGRSSVAKNQSNFQLQGLERLLGSEEHLIFLQRTQVWFLAPVLGGS